jgi:restriction system protein
LSVLALGGIIWLAVRLGAARQPGPLTILLVSAAVVLGVVLTAATRPLRDRLGSWRRLRALHLADVDVMDGDEFEHYVCALLEGQGFQVRRTGCPDDRGVDIVAERGERRYAVQVKRHRGLVSRHAVSDAVGGVKHYGCDAAMVVTNSRFGPGAVALAESNDCHLVDRDLLAGWIVDLQRGQRRTMGTTETRREAR